MGEHVDLSGSSGLVRAGREPDMTRLAEELVASANERGIALTGDGGGVVDGVDAAGPSVRVGGRDGRPPGVRQA